MKFYELQERSPEILERLLVVWEESVRATHGFLSEEVLQIKEYVPQALEQVEHLAVAETASGKLAGFLGAEKDRLEMLFSRPFRKRKGTWKAVFAVRYGAVSNPGAYRE